MAEKTSNLSNSNLDVEDPSWQSGLVDGVIALITVLGNVLVILLILTRPSLRKLENWFVLSLAVADFLVAAIVFPLRLGIGYLYVGKRMFFINAIHNVFIYASTANLCGLTLDRYLYIVHPLNHVRWKNKTNLIKMTLVAWLVVFFLPLTGMVINLYVENTEVQKIFVFFTLCLESVPCLCLPTAYFHLVYFVRRQKAQMNVQTRQVQHTYVLNNPVNERRQTSRRSKILVLGGVLIFFVLSNTVNITRAWLKYLVSTPIINSTLSRTSFYLIHANSAINVFVYGLFKEDFRKEMERVFRKCNTGASDLRPAAVAVADIELRWKP